MALTSGTAIDISNYSTTLDPAEVDWLKDNAALVIVRLSTEDGSSQREVAAQQVGALAEAAIPWQGYLWAYVDQDPYVHWQLAQEHLPSHWPGYYGSNIWIDFEDPFDPPADAFIWMSAYASILREDGFAPGVYTGEWWIQQHPEVFAGQRAYYWAKYPLWFARYNNNPQCRPPGIAPWKSVAMHQYRSVKAGEVLSSYDVSRICNVE